MGGSPNAVHPASLRPVDVQCRTVRSCATLPPHALTCSQQLAPLCTNTPPPTTSRLRCRTGSKRSAFNSGAAAAAVTPAKRTACGTATTYGGRQLGAATADTQPHPPPGYGGRVLYCLYCTNPGDDLTAQARLAPSVRGWLVAVLLLSKAQKDLLQAGLAEAVVVNARLHFRRLHEREEVGQLLFA